MSIRTNIFSLTKLFEDGHIMEISLEFERRAKAYNDLLAENERLRKAGDDLADSLEHRELYDDYTMDLSLKCWNAAKEGGSKS